MHPEHPSDPPRSYLPYGSGRLAYTDEGEGERVIVAIPGLPGSVRDFRWIAPALTPHVRLIRIELPGYGESTRVGYRGLNIAQRAAPVLALLQALDLPPLTLLGHSAGGTVVSHLARRAPERVRHCVFIASPSETPHFSVTGSRVLAATLRRRVGRTLGAPALRRVYRALGFPTYLTTAELTYASLDAAQLGFAEHAANTRRLSQPSLVAWAEDDRLMPHAASAEFGQLPPRAEQLVFPTGGHALQKTQALELAEAILARYA